MVKKIDSSKSQSMDKKHANVLDNAAEFPEEQNQVYPEKKENSAKPNEENRVKKNKSNKARKLKRKLAKNLKRIQGEIKSQPKEADCKINIVLSIEHCNSKKAVTCRCENEMESPIEPAADGENIPTLDIMDILGGGNSFEMDPIPGVNFTTFVSESANWNCTIL